MDKVYLRFECGAKLPQSGYADRKNAMDIKGLLVRGEGMSEKSKPIMPNGKLAECYFCPANKRKAGRREQRVWSNEKKGEITRIVTCRPVIRDKT